MLRTGLAGWRAEPGVAHRQVGAALDAGDVGQEHRLAVLQADDEAGDVVGVGEERAGGERRVAVGADAVTGLGDDVRRLQRAGQRVD